MNQVMANDELRVNIEVLEDFVYRVLAAVADEDTAQAATRAMIHGSRLGVDSHGVRLLKHYIAVMEGGRVNPRPSMRVTSSNGATATLDADNGHGALAAYRAMDEAVTIAERMGIGAVTIQHSSHFGPAGAYALAAAERGYIGIAVCNSDSFVRLHDGKLRFHGTNPIAAAVPITHQQPWLLDMATSAIPYNRVQLYRSLDRPLPEGVASDSEGRDVSDAALSEMLAPLGGAFGFKGAGLAGLVEILSAVLSGMRLSFDIPPMPGPDISTPRALGAFVLALKPGAFLDQASFEAGMTRYLKTLRSSPAIEEKSVMAPGDREWHEASQRQLAGIPIDPQTRQDFEWLAERYDVALNLSARKP